MDWSEEAFARAAAENKPILMNVRALWSRASLWAEEKIYTDAEVIRLANDRWVPVRVDRDRRPDIDMRYQVAVNALAPGESGWPLTALLFDNGEAFYGGSFIPIQDRRGKPGLQSLLERSADFYATSREKAAGSRDLVLRAFGRERAAFRPAAIHVSLVNEIADAMIAALDPDYGGLGVSPRVVHPYSLELAATLYQRTGSQTILDVILKTLRGMEAGAIHDRLGGGFHRASTDAAWRSPEFEKLLNYNAPILVDLLLAHQATGDPDLLRAAHGVVDFLLGTLQDPEGGFYVGQRAAASSQDPEGIAYSWSLEQFKAAVPAQHEKVASLLFNVTAEGDLALGPPPRSLLFLTMDRKEASDRLGMAEEALRKAEVEILDALKRSRTSRLPAPVEEAIYVDSCSSAVVALLEASRVLDRDDARAAALAALNRMLAASAPDGTLLHRLEPPPQKGVDPALALDHLNLARAALAAYEVTWEDRYLSGARRAVDRALALFWDPAEGGFFDVAEDPAGKGYLRIRRRLPNDTAYPALNSLAARVLARLALHTGDASYMSRAESALKGLIATTRKLDHQHGGLGLAVEALVQPPSRYLVVGREGDPVAQRLLESAGRIFDPNKLVRALRPGRDDDEIEALRARRQKPPYVILCRGQACSDPARDEAALKALAEVRRAPAAH